MNGFTALSGVDAACLYLDTPKQPMNNLGVLVLEPAPGRGFRLEDLMRRLERGVRALPVLRRRLASVPFGIEHPFWAPCPELRVGEHVHHVRAPAPVSERAFTRIVGRIAARPLDRSRPLWAVHVVEGLSEGRVGLVMVIHHALADGVAGAALMARLLDLTPDAAAPGATDDAGAADAAPPADDAGAAGAAPPADGASEAAETGPEALLAETLRRLADRPAAVARALGATAVAARGVAAELFGRGRSGPGPALPLDARPAPWNDALSPRRTVAYARSPRHALETVRRGLGGTLNDVVLTACALSLRRYLEAQGEPPEAPLLATLPVSVRRPEQADEAGNRLSAMFMRLPVHLEDPLDQLLTVQRETLQAKRLQRAVGSSLLGHWCELASPAVFSAGARLYSTLGLARWHRPLHNLVISNVPGPPMPLYAAGARVASAHPHGPLHEGAGLNLTVMSYADSVDFGLIACPERVPDAAEIANGWSAAVGDLVKLTLEESGDRAEEASGQLA